MADRDDDDPEAAVDDAIVVAPRPSLALAILGASLAMVVPPVLAALISGLALAVVVGMVSILTGLVGMALVIYQHEKWQRRDPPAPLPRARLLPKP